MALDEAVALWNASDLSSVAGCHRLLLVSAENLAEAHRDISRVNAIDAAAIRSTVAAIRSRIFQLGRTVDAASAFVRGLAISSGLTSSTYLPDGRMSSTGL